MQITIAGRPYVVEYTENPLVITEHIKKESPKFITFDTETTGLHIKKDIPFLGAVCFNQTVYVFPTSRIMMNHLKVWGRLVKRIYGHNVTYDMHMVANVTGDKEPLEVNWGDTMGLARLTLEAVSARDGGDKIGLKTLGKKYIDRDSDRYEKAVKKWLKDKTAADNRVFTAMLKGIGWTKKAYMEALKTGEGVTQEILDLHKQWSEAYPAPTYQDVPIDIMLPYLAVDVILTKELVLKCLPVVVHRKQESVMERENKCLKIVYKMEREGIEVDLDYLHKANTNLGNYIGTLYEELHQLTGEKFSVGQHGFIKKMYTQLLGEEPESTDKKFLKKQIKEGDRVAEIITRLRRLEKWKATYIERIIEVASYDGRFYTQLNQFNPVSGRFSGDAQQFPKDPIYTEEGHKYEKENPNGRIPLEHILYHPRKAFKGGTYYLDYSQVELRCQAHYTLYFGGDLNLCRAYMPYRCTHYKTGETFAFESLEDRQRWGELREGAPTDLHWEDALEQGWSAWVNPDTEKPWVPTDVHSATTSKALVVMGYDVETMDKESFKWWRSKGKTFNFMRNYGGGDAMAAETLDITFEQAQAMNKGYTEAFPVVVTYQNKVVEAMRQKGYAENLYGRRYYVTDWSKHYKVGNYLIQGSCADFLKQKMIEIDEFLVTNNCQTKMILCVHDELQFRKAAGEEWVIAEIQKIMEDCGAMIVPIVAEVEMTNTSWDEKKKISIVA